MAIESAHCMVSISEWYPCTTQLLIRVGLGNKETQLSCDHKDICVFSLGSQSLYIIIRKVKNGSVFTPGESNQ